MTEDRLQLQRFELKYRVHASIAPGIRDFVATHLVLDEFSAGKPNNSYHNHSIYLDSDDLKLYWDVINSNKNRYKLRIRFYDDNPTAPVFFEIKRRTNDAILKRRGPVRREAVSELLAGHLPAPDHMFSNDPNYLVTVQQFCQLMHDLQATPKAHVAYLREAWVSPMNNAVRVTMDREVCNASHFGPEFSTRIENYAMPFGPDVILELKYVSRFPDWFGELVRAFDLMQCGAAKYADGVAVRGEHEWNPAFDPPERADLVERFLDRRKLNNRLASDALT
jgi:hypothetical protein